jgi:mannose-6-phosphate isomerase-like protein (cupin superfamily)
MFNRVKDELNQSYIGKLKELTASLDFNSLVKETIFCSENIENAIIPSTIKMMEKNEIIVFKHKMLKGTKTTEIKENFLNLFIIYDGKMSVLSENKEKILNVGDFYYVNNNIIYSLFFLDDTSFIQIKLKSKE